MAGLFDSPNATNYKASNVWDVIPADVVVNDILAAAAAVAAGLSRSVCVTETSNGRLLEGNYSPSNSSSSSSGAGGRLEGYRKRNTPGSKGTSRTGSNTISLQAFSQGLEQQQQQQQAATAQQPEEEQPLLIVHIGSSTLYPLTIMESWNYGIEAYGAWATGLRLCTGCAPPLTVDHEPNPALAAKHVAWTGWKVWVVAKILR